MSSEWVLGPFIVMILGQTCHECGAYIPPGSTGYRCDDGWVRCAEHRPGDTREDTQA